MARLQSKSFDTPDEVRTIRHGNVQDPGPW